MFSKIWKLFPLLLITTAFALLIYAIAQQTIRLGANELPTQLSEDAAAALAAGVLPSAVVPNAQIDISKSLAPYLVVYDDAGSPITSSALLDNKYPTLPSGVFEYTKVHGQDRVTWQTKSGVRSAIVVTRFSGTRSGFVMAGKNMREVERLTSQILMQTMAGWAATVAVLIGWAFFPFMRQRRRR